MSSLPPELVESKEIIREYALEYGLDFFETFYASNNLVVSIAGDFDADEAIALIERHMGSLDPAEEIPRNPVEVWKKSRGRRRRWGSGAPGDAPAQPAPLGAVGG